MLELALNVISKSKSCTAAIVIDEYDPGCLKRGLDGEEGAGMGGAGAALEVDDGALGPIGDLCRALAFQAVRLMSCGQTAVSKLMRQNRSVDLRYSYNL